MGEGILPSRPLLAVAPMIAVSNTHFRNFMRLITRHSTVYTEMVVDSTILHNTHQLEEYLGFDEIEHPIVCQLGGSNPETLADAASWAERVGYDELNLNVGCPSCRVVAKGCFGAALMRTPAKVRDIVHEMKRRVQIPVTVKCRLGVDHLDSPEFTRNFVDTVAQGGCKHFIVHARKAWLQGVDPKKNRSVPPLLYERVFELCDTFPELHFSLNGGVSTLELADKLLSGEWRKTKDTALAEPHSGGTGTTEGLQYSGLHGVMIGRAAMNDPCCLAQTDKLIYDTSIRRSAPDETAVEALHHAMDAVDDEFPGVLDYPLSMGKNPRYEELASSLGRGVRSSE
ncbi:dihydrouridine synthase domain-containing protein, putative [Eimeria praecox]|uniref:tRNA-dihydrouridine synthase n=1 Tax=Eimeria praecox TaxID=51316 RepID=U6G704_9EIME|nr:dihydrouridine synthase domain-containing protein, putative [Eimeria praecox]